MNTHADRKAPRRPTAATTERIVGIFTAIGRALARGDSYDTVVRAVVRAATELTRADAGSVLVLDPASGNLIHRAGSGLSGAERTISFEPGEGIAGWVAARGRACVVRDARRDRRFSSKKGQRRAIRSMVCVPVTLKRRCVGVLTVTSARVNAFRTADARLLAMLAAQVAVDLENVRLEAIASRDPLTGIANRRAFDEALAARLAYARHSHTPLAVALLDLDHFKKVNDSLGHPAGDVVLKEAVRRWLLAIRGLDILARLGGEEFGLLLPGANGERARDVAERLRRRTAETPFLTRRGRIAVTVSVGIAIAPRGLGTPKRLVAAADRALYRAKHAGRDRVEIA